MKVFASALLAVISQAARYAVNDLEDCALFAANFANTCTDVYYDDLVTNSFDWDSHSGEAFTCSGIDQLCVGSDDVSNTQCSFNQKLCVSCRIDAEDDVWIRVRTNALPSHCFRSFTTAKAGGTEDKFVMDFDIDWEVRFNADVNDYYTVNEADIDDSEKATELLCNENNADA
jgi:hypothetical protein